MADPFEFVLRYKFNGCKDNSKYSYEIATDFSLLSGRQKNNIKKIKLWAKITIPEKYICFLSSDWLFLKAYLNGLWCLLKSNFT
jgi:hypothetical protein